MSKLHLASWNIRKCVGLDRRRDPGRVARVLSGIGADVVALQEADRRLGRRPAALPRWLLEAETDYQPVEAATHEISLGWHGNAILLGPDITCQELHTLHLPGVEPRGAIVADIAGKGARLRVVAVHLGLLRRSRHLQFNAIRAHLETLRDRPTVILGDFNEWSDAQGLEGLHDYDVCAPGHTFHSARPVAALDRFAVGEGVELRDAAVIETPMTRVASDHLPIEAKVRVESD